MSNEEFVSKARNVHGDKYDYSKVEYVNGETKLCIICPKHGEFWQTPENHLQGRGCKQCSIERQVARLTKTKDKFVEDCVRLHGDKFSYEDSDYVNCHVKVKIKCNKCGNYFFMTPHNHLTHKEGCPFCKQSKLENDIEDFLITNDIAYEKQKVFDWLVNGKSVKRLDFYLPQYDMAIECQGKQHFKPIEWFGGKKNFELQVLNDKVKREECNKHGITVIYYSNLKNVDFPYSVFNDVESILSFIKKS